MPPKKRGRPQKAKLGNCVRCSVVLSKSYQLIFDETGIELDLKNLLSICFGLHITENQNEIQAICDECLNQLIEVFDVMQKNAQDEVEASTSGFVNEDIGEIKEEDVAEGLSNYREINLNEEENDTTHEGDCVTFDLKCGENDVNYETDTSIKSEQFLENDECESTDKEIALKDEEGEDSVDSAKFENSPEEFEGVVYLDEYDDKIDFREYKSKVLRSKFVDIIFPENIVCRFCPHASNKHIDIVNHVEAVHCVDDFAYPCPVDMNCEPLKSPTDLSFHLVFKHYDLNELTIYSHCPECDKRFNDYVSYNKHSCYQGEKISRSATECEICGKTFKSNKRYRFHQQFHQEKRRPKACLICDKLFRDEDEFFEHIMYSHEKDLGYVCISCDRSFTSAENLKHHETIHTVDRPYRCKLCNKSYLYNQLLKDHMISRHGETRFKCHICGKCLIKKTLLNKHVLSHNKPEPVEVTSCSVCGLIADGETEAENHLEDHEQTEEPKLVSEVLDVVYCCEYCELAYNTIENMIAHRETHSKKEYYCDMCPLSYDQYKKLKTHKLTHINYIDKRKTFPVMRHYVCDYPGCTMSYLQWPSLKSHKRHKHDDKKEFKCPKCLAIFQNSVVFKSHMENAHLGAAFECQFCSNTYGTKMALAVHIARRHNTSRFSCDSCNNSYATEELLQKHKISAHNNYTCEICGKLLKNLKNYQIHQRMVHEKEKRFFCKYCNKGYFNNCDKDDHEKSVHEKVKKYKCELCPYAAVYKESLTIHMRAHRNETPFVCKLCGKGFRRNYALELHTRRHYDIRDFVCPYEGCDSAYPNQGILNSHIRSKHGDNVSNTSTRKRKNTGDFVPRSRFVVPPVDVFVDDDDGLDDGVIGEPQPKVLKEEYADEVNADDPVHYIVEESSLGPSVIVEKNDSDHTYMVRLQENKIYENIIDEYEVVEGEVS